MFTRFQKVQSVLKLLFSNPKKIMDLYDKNAQIKKYLLSKYGKSQLPSIEINELFPHLNEVVHHYTFLEGTSLVTDIALLKALARKYEGCNYLEIGSFRGESIVNVAEIANNCTSLTLSKEEMRKMGFSEKFIQVSGVFMNNLKNVQRIEANSLTYNFKNLNQQFDLIFIDGDHSYEGVRSDTSNTFPLLKDKNSVLAWHDYGNYTEKVNYEVLAGILDGLPAEEHKYLYHISNTMCAIYIKDLKQELKTSFVEFPAYPNKIFSLTINTSSL